MADEEIAPAEALARLRIARGKQLAAIARFDVTLAQLERDLVELETARDRARRLSVSETRKRRGPKRAAGVLAGASIGATISLSLALGPLGLLGLVGVGIGTGVAYAMDRGDRKNEDALDRAISVIDEKIRQPTAWKQILTKDRAKVEDKLKMTRGLLDKLRG